MVGRVFSISRIRGKNQERIWIVCEYFPSTLESLIREKIHNRGNNPEPFLKSEIYDLIQLCIKNLSQLFGSHVHFNIKPSNIYF